MLTRDRTFKPDANRTLIVDRLASIYMLNSIKSRLMQQLNQVKTFILFIWWRFQNNIYIPAYFLNY